jgi:hypothetical protein
MERISQWLAPLLVGLIIGAGGGWVAHHPPTDHRPEYFGNNHHCR